MPDFIPGLELSRRFYAEVVRPILDERLPGLAHAAALVGPGSDVPGFDTGMSTDHTAFSRLRSAKVLSPYLWQAQRAATWRERAAALGHAFAHLATLQNELGITAPLPTTASSFHDRPYQVIDGGAFASSILAQVDDPAVRQIAERRLIGGIDQFSDNTDLMAGLGAWRANLRELFTLNPE